MSSVITASNSSGCATGNNRKESRPSGNKSNPSTGNQIVSGRPTSTSSSAEITHDVSFRRRDNKADTRCTRSQHAFQQIFTDGKRTLGLAVVPSTDGQQFLRKGKRLDARAETGGRNHSPAPAHADASSNRISSRLRWSDV